MEVYDENEIFSDSSDEDENNDGDDGKEIEVKKQVIDEEVKIKQEEIKIDNKEMEEIIKGMMETNDTEEPIKTEVKEENKD